eukprot:296365-Amphidinium_carterae.1
MVVAFSTKALWHALYAPTSPRTVSPVRPGHGRRYAAHLLSAAAILVKRVWFTDQLTVAHCSAPPTALRKILALSGWCQRAVASTMPKSSFLRQVCVLDPPDFCHLG